MKIDINNLDLFNQFLRIITTNQGFYIPIVLLSFLIFIWKKNPQIENRENTLNQIFDLTNEINKKFIDQPYYKKLLEELNKSKPFTIESLNFALDPNDYVLRVFRNYITLYATTPINLVFLYFLKKIVYRSYYSIRIRNINQTYLNSRINSALSRTNLGRTMKLRFFGWMYNEYFKKSTLFFINFK